MRSFASFLFLALVGGALAIVDYHAVQKDITEMLTDSKAFWPADYGNYGPLLVRQAWHCSGSYRLSDGRGGCAGGRQRFNPELSWEDNTNLDKTKTLLWPIKEKYGDDLSWGDLMVLAGTTAIQSMGGPVLGFCGGRIDDMNGDASIDLGPTPQQEKRYPCPVNGECKCPLGSTTIGLIYLNPEGPMGNYTALEESALEIRDSFGRMSMDDEETVALIGGGHAFGKAHGACPKGPGPSPKEDPDNPWPGMCGTGKGKDTFTSGFEGKWTPHPTSWDNDYFKQLVTNEFKAVKGPGGKFQYESPSLPGQMMLTTDIALMHDPTGAYQRYVHAFAANQTYLDEVFARAWYKLTTRDQGPYVRCVGPMVPPAQPFQNPLPAPPSDPVPYDAMKSAIRKAMTTASDALVPDTDVKGGTYYGAVFVELAWRCAATFRSTDYQGGCNGGRIRIPPQSEWPQNLAMDRVIEVLSVVREGFGASLTFADLIVAGGQLALEDAGVDGLTFCAGRSDADDDSGSPHTNRPLDGQSSFQHIQEFIDMFGLSIREYVALSGRLRSPQQQGRVGYTAATWTNDTNVMSNSFFRALFDETWVKQQHPVSGLTEYKAVGKDMYLHPADMVLRYEPDFMAIAQEYASDNDLFLADFARAWTKVVNADRFTGPTSSPCQ